MNKQILHELIDVLEDSDVNVVYQVLLKFANYDFPSQDEAIAIEQARKQHDEGVFYTHEEVWGD